MGVFWLFFIFLSVCAANDGISVSLPGKKGYICAGDGFYLCGTQEGSFVPHGWHLSGEMSGLWMQPIKLIDSFHIIASTSLNGKKSNPFPLTNAKTFTQFPFANTFSFSSGETIIERTDSIIDTKGLMVEMNSNEESSLLFNIKPNLRGTWLADIEGYEDDIDDCISDEWNTITCKDRKNARFLAISSSTAMEDTTFHNNIQFNVNMNKKNSTLFQCAIYISGSTISREEARGKVLAMKSDASTFLSLRKDIFRKINETAFIEIPDKQIQFMFEWAKYNVRWLYHSIAPWGSGILGGLPEYPMFYGCDTTYTVEGLLAVGMYEEAKESLALLSSASLRKNGDGRILHEMTALGTVYNPGNIQETAHYIIQAKNVYTSTMDIEWLKNQFEQLYQGASFLMKADTDGNYLPEGTGIMEIGSFYIKSIEMVDVAAYALDAYKALLYLYSELSHAIQSEPGNFGQRYDLDDIQQRIDCREHSEANCLLKGCFWSPISEENYNEYNLPSNTPWCHFRAWGSHSKENYLARMDAQVSLLIQYHNGIDSFLHEHGWLEEEKTFAEFFATPSEVVGVYENAIQRLSEMKGRETMKQKLQKSLKAIREIIERDPLASHKKRGWNVFQSWITAIPMERGLFNSKEASLALVEAKKYATTFGMYVTGIDKPDKEINARENKAGGSQGIYANAVMTLPTGIQSVAEATYGRTSESLHYLKTLSNSFSFETPGSLHEMSPAGGCFVQAWNIYSIAVPLVRGLFGVESSVIEQKMIVSVSPLFPVDWKYMRLTAFPVGMDDIHLSIDCKMDYGNRSVSCDLVMNGIELKEMLIDDIELVFNLKLSQDFFSSVDIKLFDCYINNNFFSFFINHDTVTLPLPHTTERKWKVAFIPPKQPHKDEL